MLLACEVWAVPPFFFCAPLSQRPKRGTNRDPAGVSKVLSLKRCEAGQVRPGHSRQRHSSVAVRDGAGGFWKTAFPFEEADATIFPASMIAEGH